MKTIQKWFEQLAGISEDELERIALATRVFADNAKIDTSSLKMPACWRRGSEVRFTQNQSETVADRRQPLQRAADHARGLAAGSPGVCS